MVISNDSLAFESFQKLLLQPAANYISILDPVSLFFQTEEKLYKSVPTRARVMLASVEIVPRLLAYQLKQTGRNFFAGVQYTMMLQRAVSSSRALQSGLTLSRAVLSQRRSLPLGRWGVACRCMSEDTDSSSSSSGKPCDLF